MTIHFILNSRPVSAEADAAQSLLEILRDLGCHSVRSGCDSGNCGICTVWVDELPILSCGYPAIRANGHRVTTVEGLGVEADELMNALAAEGADQCGFCSPGFIMAAAAMLRELRDPTEEEIRAYLAGNLCRCSGYMSQSRALKRIYDTRRGGHEE